MGSNPTLSATPAVIRFALRMLWRPAESWQALKEAGEPTWSRSLFGHVAPLAVIPTLFWPSVTTFAACLGVVLLAAVALYLLAPVFDTRRQWDRAMAIAAFSSTPVLLVSPLLDYATLTILVVVAGFHACFLCRVGVERLLGCRSEDAAMYVAAAGFVGGVFGVVLGGLSSAAGIL